MKQLDLNGLKSNIPRRDITIVREKDGDYCRPVMLFYKR